MLWHKKVALSPTYTSLQCKANIEAAELALPTISATVLASVILIASSKDSKPDNAPPGLLIRKATVSCSEACISIWMTPR